MTKSCTKCKWFDKSEENLHDGEIGMCDCGIPPWADDELGCRYIPSKCAEVWPDTCCCYSEILTGTTIECPACGAQTTEAE